MEPLYKPGNRGLCTGSVSQPGQAGEDQEGQKGGCVWAKETKEASSAQELDSVFQQACANKHVSATGELSIPCHAAKFKQDPAKWFGLILLVTVSVIGRHLDTSLLGSEWHSRNKTGKTCEKL